MTDAEIDNYIKEAMTGLNTVWKVFCKYARQNPGVGRIQLIRMQRDSVGRERAFRLDMSKSSIRDKVSRCASNDELNRIFESDGFFQ